MSGCFDSGAGGAGSDILDNHVFEPLPLKCAADSFSCFVLSEMSQSRMVVVVLDDL